MREHYIEAPRPPALARLEYRSQDGWRSSVLHVPAAPGGSGEPVVLVHALGFGADAFRYGAGPTLVEHLSGAGFSVYLLQHRGDRESLAPPTVEPGFSFDDIVEHDLAAAFACVRAHSGYTREPNQLAVRPYRDPSDYRRRAAEWVYISYALIREEEGTDVPF